MPNKHPEDWDAFYRDNPDLFARDFLHLRLTRLQKILLAVILKMRRRVMKEKKDRLTIYHHTLGKADQYFVSRGHKVLFGIPRFIGKIFDYFYERRHKE